MTPDRPEFRSKEQELRVKDLDIFCPLAVENWLSTLRDERTDTPTFRRNADAISLALGMRLAENLQPVTREIETPVSTTQARFINAEKTLLVSVLRSGLPMCQGIRLALPNASLALVDIKRDEETALPSLNYDGLPPSLTQFDRIIVPDPMLATGGSASLTLDMLKAKGASNIEVVSMVSAPEGIARIQRDHPGTKIITCAVDKGLNSTFFIVDGLGDFGNRYFGNDPWSVLDPNTGKILVYQETKLTVEESEEPL